MEMCMIAIKQNWKAFQYIPDNMKTCELCTKAIKENKEILQCVPENKKKLYKSVI